MQPVNSLSWDVGHGADHLMEVVGASDNLGCMTVEELDKSNTSGCRFPEFGTPDNVHYNSKTLQLSKIREKWISGAPQHQETPESERIFHLFRVCHRTRGSMEDQMRPNQASRSRNVMAKTRSVDTHCSYDG